MTRYFQREIDKLKKKVLTLSAMVEESVYRAVKAVETRDDNLAQAVKDADVAIDDMEVEVEEECLKVLALHQPVAIDLRFIVAVMKMTNDLERIGDLAVNIAFRGRALAKLDKAGPTFNFEGMAQKVKQMLRKSLEALVNLDTELARDVCANDDEVDALNREMYDKIRDSIKSHPELIDNLLPLFLVSRNLERIADHTTNIAEDVIYMVEGAIVRHGHNKNK